MRGGLPEILAPAGSQESLLAAVRCGAGAVYLGGQQLNARRGAENFDGPGIARAVSYCHARGVKVYLALNTLAFDDEREAVEEAVADACAAGVDGVIVQDLGVARWLAACAPGLPLHASTQMSVHNREGVEVLADLGFSRVVLARELSRDELERIASSAKIQLEVFVHGALCMCVSGQCYLSALLGGRSGNRGLCAQPCRLPFASRSSSYALSLRDLSLVESLSELARMGIASLKIEGRLKRPEYVAAAVRACRQALAGEEPDQRELAAVFSRSGFTRGYYDGTRGDAMFGTREKEDVQAGAGVLGGLAALYRKETPLVPVDMSLTLTAGRPLALNLGDDDGHRITRRGECPQEARSAPTTLERARGALTKTGGTPFFLRELTAEIEPGQMVPASALNALRRDALQELEALRGAARPHAFSPKPWMAAETVSSIPGAEELRVRVGRGEQLTRALLEEADGVILPLALWGALSPELLAPFADKIIVELPRLLFEVGEGLRNQLAQIRGAGVSRLLTGGLWGVPVARELGFRLHGDFGLNLTNSQALMACRDLGFADVTLSPELSLGRLRKLARLLPFGLLAYGHLPLMLTRNPPAGTGGAGDTLTDRKGNTFPLAGGGDGTELLNPVPLYLADRLEELAGPAFFTLYFTGEAPEQCRDVLGRYRRGEAMEGEKTRGLLFRKVL